MYLSLHCHHQNDLCIKMGSDESHFNVSVGSDGHSHKTGVEPMSFYSPCSNTLPLSLNCLFAEQTSDSSTNYNSFLIELLVRRTWFGQFDQLFFVLKWLIMSCKLRPELAAEAQQTA